MNRNKIIYGSVTFLIVLVIVILIVGITAKKSEDAKHNSLEIQKVTMSDGTQQELTEPDLEAFNYEGDNTEIEIDETNPNSKTVSDFIRGNTDNDTSRDSKESNDKIIDDAVPISDNYHSIGNIYVKETPYLMLTYEDKNHIEMYGSGNSTIEIYYDKSKKVDTVNKEILNEYGFSRFYELGDVNLTEYNEIVEGVGIKDIDYWPTEETDPTCNSSYQIRNYTITEIGGKQCRWLCMLNLNTKYYISYYLYQQGNDVVRVKVTCDKWGILNKIANNLISESIHNK